ncbi:purine and uridine phosphorylase, partial [Amniculicola lignicola CBS 123094]
SKPSTNDFKIAVVCALPVEDVAIQAMFDVHYGKKDGLPINVGNEEDKEDWNVYPGKIGDQYVVMLRTRIGTDDASNGRAALRREYKRITLVFVVGVCGGIPHYTHSVGQKVDVLLGDVVVSHQILAHDLRKQHHDHFTLQEDPYPLRKLSRKVENFVEKRGVGKDYKLFKDHVTKIMDETAKTLEPDSQVSPQYLGADHDTLFEYDYNHPGGDDCSDCDPKKVVHRDRLGNSSIAPEIHFGTVASGNMVMKSGKDRDYLALIAKKYKAKIVGFEMEGAGVDNQVLDVIVVKGVCDYADSHKNKDWQPYAAFVGAATFKALV